MICFPNAKINIGLNVIEKRPDGYHNIETIFYPIGWKDVLEAVPSDTYRLQNGGIHIDGDSENNLVTKAYRLLEKNYHIRPMNVYLHKVIPFGAGLGGGSSDAAFLLKLINEMEQLGLSEKQLESYAAQLGADCSFFIRNEAVYAYQKGEAFKKIKLSLKGYFLVLIKPNIPVSTAEAYSGITPKKPAFSLIESIQQPIDTWKDTIVNDFEKSVFASHPAIAKIKEDLYQLGAVYASMSGSGSSVYGIFSKEVSVPENFPKLCYWADFL